MGKSLRVPLLRACRCVSCCTSCDCSYWGTWSTRLLKVLWVGRSISFSFFLCNFPCPFSHTNSIINQICDLVIKYWWITGEISLLLHRSVGRNEWVYEIMDCKIMDIFQKQHNKFGGIKGQKSEFRGPNLSFVFPLRKSKFSDPCWCGIGQWKSYGQSISMRFGPRK